MAGRPSGLSLGWTPRHVAAVAIGAGPHPRRHVGGRTPHPSAEAGEKPCRGADEPTCTPGSVAARRYRRGGGGHPSRPAVAGGLARPTRRLGRAALERLLYGLAPNGVCRAAAVACGAGGLLPHRFTLTGWLSGRRSVLCGAVPRVTPGGR